MRKVELTMTEKYKYQITKKLVETNGEKNSGHLKLGCTRRTINRTIKGYKKEGKAFFQKMNAFELRKQFSKMGEVCFVILVVIKG